MLEGGAIVRKAEAAPFTGVSLQHVAEQVLQDGPACTAEEIHEVSLAVPVGEKGAQVRGDADGPDAISTSGQRIRHEPILRHRGGNINGEVHDGAFPTIAAWNPMDTPCVLG